MSLKEAKSDFLTQLHSPTHICYITTEYTPGAACQDSEYSACVNRNWGDSGADLLVQLGQAPAHEKHGLHIGQHARQLLLDQLEAAQRRAKLDPLICRRSGSNLGVNKRAIMQSTAVPKMMPMTRKPNIMCALWLSHSKLVHANLLTVSHSLTYKVVSPLNNVSTTITGHTVEIARRSASLATP
jgi:hypothetical protein